MERVRVIDLETSGSSSHEVCEIGWQDVVRNPDGQWAVDAERGALFVNPGRPISPAMTAIHHILDEDVASAPYWKDVAPGVLKPAGGVLALAAHRADFEQRYCTALLCGGAAWICTWKCALRLWPNLSGFSNQVLRYERMPEGLDRETGLPAHRALPDAYVTAHHLRDMLNQASLEELLTWSQEPGLLPRVPAGPERGRPWTSVSAEALQAFTQDRDPNLRFSAETELRRRGQMNAPAAKPPAQRTLF